MIDLTELSSGFPGLTSALGDSMAQAASVCLEDRGHALSATLFLRYGDADSATPLNRCAVTRQMRDAFNDLQEATELGACGIAILVIKGLTGLIVVQRSRKGTGFDYYLASAGGTLFQEARALEVSGILQGNQDDTRRRMLSKQQQVRRTGAGLPAYVAIVEFGRPGAWVTEP